MSEWQDHTTIIPKRRYGSWWELSQFPLARSLHRDLRGGLVFERTAYNSRVTGDALVGDRRTVNHTGSG